MIETTAMMHGWKVRSFPGPDAIHLRPFGSGSPQGLRRHVAWGQKFHAIGYHPLYFAASTVRRVGEPPYVISAGAKTVGYVGAVVTRRPRAVSPDVMAFLRREQVRRMMQVRGRRRPAASPNGVASPTLPTVRLFGYEIAAATLGSTVDHLVALARRDASAYVVTMNVDHVVELQRNERFRSAYEHAAVRVADGMPVVVTAKLLGLALPGRVTGADLMSALIPEAWRLQLRVAIVGGAQEVNEQALANLRLTYPGLDVAGWSPYGFDGDAERAAAIADQLRARAPRVVFVCFGAPRSEIWVAEHRHLLPPGVVVCAGAGVDFLAGAKKRAPAWIQRGGLEWLYRLLLEPSRLWRRYLVRDLAFVPIALRELWTRRRGCAARSR